MRLKLAFAVFIQALPIFASEHEIKRLPELKSSFSPQENKHMAIPSSQTPTPDELKNYSPTARFKRKAEYAASKSEQAIQDLRMKNIERAQRTLDESDLVENKKDISKALLHAIAKYPSHAKDSQFSLLIVQRPDHLGWPNHLSWKEETKRYENTSSHIFYIPENDFYIIENLLIICGIHLIEQESNYYDDIPYHSTFLPSAGYRVFVPSISREAKFYN